jgi:hypothetical protein
MRIPYAIISISKNKNRINNVKKIQNVIGFDKENVKFYDAKNLLDQKDFEKTFLEFKIKDYAKNLDGGPLARPRNRALGEAGVWMSNISCWQYVVDNNLDGMIIFEDDCIVDSTKLNYFIQKIKSSNLDVLFAGQYCEAFYVTKHGAQKLLDLCLEYFHICPMDEGLFRMWKDKKILSNGIPAYRAAEEGRILANRDIIFLQSCFAYNENDADTMLSEINDMKE